MSEHTFTRRHFDDPATADEIVAHDIRSLHLERMSDSHVWIGITDRSGRVWHVNITIPRATISMTAEDHGKPRESHG